MCRVLSLVLRGQPLPGPWHVPGSSHEETTRLAGVCPSSAEHGCSMCPLALLLRQFPWAQGGGGGDEAQRETWGLPVSLLLCAPGWAAGSRPSCAELCRAAP